MSTVECSDKYISSITLENLKDKAVAILQIYLKIGNSYYLQLEDHQISPLIIKPFEVYQKNFNPVLFYSVNCNRIKINDLLDNKKIPKRIILYTTSGPYKVKSFINTNHLLAQLFKNHWTADIIPRRLTFEKRSYGNNVNFLVVLRYKKKKKEIAAIKNGDTHIFKNFELTTEETQDKDALENALKTQKKKKNLKCKSFEVFDYQQRYKDMLSSYGKTIEAKYISKFQYYIFCRIRSIIDDYKLKYENYKRKKQLNNQ
ncbi:MAG: hypothetical protein A2Y17_02570 [Clostridiales bacterium GWF2_38_85]|nr:MAG: hypothetical protein A2Y17_02570 [Clostridiales bacterium GWF2_38_85]